LDATTPFLLVGLAIGAAAHAEAPVKPPRPVVVSTDLEIDDKWALAHLAFSPAIDLRGVIGSHSPNLEAPAAETAAADAKALLEALKLPKLPPVLAGSSKPIEAKDKPAHSPGLDFLLETSRPFNAENRLAVVMIGPATDVASALIADPTFADRVEVIAMGFDEWAKGGDRWNVPNDLKAWQVLIDSKVPLVVGDVVVTKQHLMISYPDAAKLLISPRGKVLVEEMDLWIKANADAAKGVTGPADSWIIFDEVATAYLLGMAHAEERPRPGLREDVSFDHSAAKGKILWVDRIDGPKLRADLAECLKPTGP
jgi:inosine-uridine nucleoside N-ribohydrolase